MDGQIKYKSERILTNCHIVPWHPQLIKVMLWIVDTTKEIVITSGYRPNSIHATDSGIHSTNPLRAIDLRHYIYKNPEALQQRINKVWQYDPKRPNLHCAFLHDTGLGMHFHIQVHDNTKAMWES